jgi:hypothetical protein
MGPTSTAPNCPVDGEAFKAENTGTLKEVQADLDIWLVEYSHQRLRQKR